MKAQFPCCLRGSPYHSHERIRYFETPKYLVHESRHARRGNVPMHGHEFTTLALVLQGDFEESYYRRSQTITCHQASTLLRPAGMLHNDRYGGQGVHSLVIELSTEQAKEIKDLGLNLQILQQWQLPELYRQAVQLQNILNENYKTKAKQIILDALIDQFLGDLLALQPNCKPLNRPPHWLKIVRDIMHDEYDSSDFGVNHVAKAVNNHPVHLARVFRQFHGCSPITYLQRLRLQRATELLLKDALSLAELASMSGFSDQSHLSRRVGKLYGLPPGRLRHFQQQT